MAVSNQKVFSLTYEAAGDLTARQYHVVALSGTKTIQLATSATTHGLLGVLLDKPNTGEFAAVVHLGSTKAVAGGNVTAGVPVTVNSVGRVVNASSGNYVIGRALEAGADAEVIEVMVHPTVRWAAI